jgi:hypothetical protein
MQEKCVSELVSTAALATAAYTRFLQGNTAPSAADQDGTGAQHATPCAVHSSSPRSKTPGLIHKISHACKRYHSSVTPVDLKARHSKRQSQSPHQCQCLLAGPRSAPDQVLKHCTELLHSAPQEAPLHTFNTSETVSDNVAQQEACILSQLSPPLHASCPMSTLSTLRRRCKANSREIHATEGIGLSDCTTVLENSCPCEAEGVRQSGSLHRTMLACEGIAINTLFTHGLPTCRVRHSRS